MQLEESGLWYNVDLLAFIYRDDLEQDLAILASDLETTARMLHPKRITVYPNYYKLKDPEGSVENRDHTFTKIRKLREVVADFTRMNGYVEANTYMFETGEKDLYSHYNQQHSLIRADVEHRSDWKLYSCSGWPNRNYHQNVLALGGYGSAHDPIHIYQTSFAMKPRQRTTAGFFSDIRGARVIVRDVREIV